MTPDEPPDDCSYPDPEEDEYIRRWEEKREGCAQTIIACWEEVSDQLSADEAWEFFAAFLKHVKPKKKTKGAHNPAFDKELLAAYDQAPPRHKTAAALAVGAKYKKTPETTDRHLRRLRHTRGQRAAAMKEWFRRASVLP